MGYSGSTLHLNVLLLVAFYVRLSNFTASHIQQVLMYFRGSGKAAEMKREAARGAMRITL